MVWHIAEAGQIMSGLLEAFCLVVHKGAVDRPRPGGLERLGDRVVVPLAGRCQRKQAEGASQRLRRSASAQQRIPCQCGGPGPECHRLQPALSGLSLPPEWHARRAGTFRYRLYAMVSQVVRYAM